MSAEFDDGKEDGALRTIGEVSKALGIKSHILRYWEEQFPMLEPLKRSGGRRYYRSEDVALIEQINQLVNGEGYTLKGARQVMENGKSDGTDTGDIADVSGDTAIEAEAQDDPSAPLELTMPMAENGGVNEFFGTATAEDEPEPVTTLEATALDDTLVEDTVVEASDDTISRAEIVIKLKAVRGRLADALAA